MLLATKIGIGAIFGLVGLGVFAADYSYQWSQTTGEFGMPQYSETLNARWQTSGLAAVFTQPVNAGSSVDGTTRLVAENATASSAPARVQAPQSPDPAPIRVNQLGKSKCGGGIFCKTSP